jgi:ClpP class serine protease
MPKKADPHFIKVLQEQNQAHPTRRLLFQRLENLLQKPVISLYTSFTQPVMLDDADADMLEGVVQKTDLSKGLVLMISSPGGDGLAAERMINICRSYSGTGEFIALVAGKAKSAATMVCFGGSRIIMGPTSELGPVDPQLTVRENGRLKRFSVYNVIQSYESLFDRATKTKGNLQPFLLQLQNYDEREIRELRSEVSLSVDIAVRSLASGMMQGESEKQIAKKIRRFLTPETTKTHGRPIYRNEARACGLNIDDISPRVLAVASELHIRGNHFVTGHAAKCIESKEHSFVANVQTED